MDEDQGNTDQKLGRILGLLESGSRERGEMHAKIDRLVSLPDLFAAHERQDDRRHSDNIGRLDKLEERMGDLETAQAESRGMRKGVGMIVAGASAIGGTGIGAWLYAVAKKWGWLALALTVLGTPHALAAPPENAAPSLAPWYQSLKQPGSGVSCCSIADCRPRDYRQNHDSYEVLIDDKWLAVPPAKILQYIANPTGRAVVCYTPTLGIMCFVRPPDT